jgi:hypothetical protein
MFLATSNGLIGASNVKFLLGVGNGFVDSELEEPSPPSCDLVDLNSSFDGRDGLAGGVVNANCGGLYDGVPYAALVRVAG